MTNLKIAHNDIILRAKSLTSSVTLDGIKNVESLASPKKYQEVRTASAETSVDFTIDLGAGNTATADFLAFPVNSQLIGQTVVLKASTDNFVGSDVTILTVTPTDIINAFTGYKAQDYIETFTESSAYRYWRINFSHGTDVSAYPMNKFFFGNLLDLNVDPDIARQSDRTDTPSFLSDGGFLYAKTIKRQETEITLEWVGVTDAKLTEFEDLFSVHHEPLIYLYTTNSSYLDGVDLISGNITEYKSERLADDYNSISIVLKEAI